MTNINTESAVDIQDGRPEIGDDDLLLAKLRAVHGEPRYDLAAPLANPPTLKKRRRFDVKQTTVSRSSSSRA